MTVTVLNPKVGVIYGLRPLNVLIVIVISHYSIRQHDEIQEQKTGHVEFKEHYVVKSGL